MNARHINLTTHIDEVVALFEQEDLSNVVLCGHSYGGMVIGRVADRIPERVKNLVFLDAVVPEDGKCMNDYVFPGWRGQCIGLSVRLFGGGYRLAPPPPAWFFKVNKADQAMVNRHLTSHPYLTLTEKIRIGNNADRIPPPHLHLGVEVGESQIAHQYELAKQRKGWKVFEVASGHDVMITPRASWPGSLRRLTRLMLRRHAHRSALRHLPTWDSAGIRTFSPGH